MPQNASIDEPGDVTFFHEHQWVQRGFGTGTSESTTIWGVIGCWCGAIYPGVTEGEVPA